MERNEPDTSSIIGGKSAFHRESPVNIECRVHHVEELGSHHMFVAEVVAVQVDDAYMDDKKSFHLSQASPLYIHMESIIFWARSWELSGTVFVKLSKRIKKRTKHLTVSAKIV